MMVPLGERAGRRWEGRLDVRLRHAPGILCPDVERNDWYRSPGRMCCRSRTLLVVTLEWGEGGALEPLELDVLRVCGCGLLGRQARDGC